MSLLSLGQAFVGDRVRVVDGGRFHFEEGRVVQRINGKMGVVFDWDENMHPYFVEAMHLEIVR
jgi:hypothetical protein